MANIRHGVVASLMGLLALGTWGCGGGSGAGPAHCGQVEPCGGDVVGTWKLVGGCFNLSSLDTSACPGATVRVSTLTASGSITLTDAKTYTTNSVVEMYTITESLPSSCIGAAGCAEFGTTLQAVYAAQTSAISASCSGNSTCVCQINVNGNAMGQSGTYSIAGNTLTSVPTSGTTDSAPYCVQQKDMHLVHLDTTMNTGPMGQATITSDIVFQKQ